MGTLIAEDLILLVADDETGRLQHTTYLDTGIGGALLMELALGGQVEVVRGDGLWSRAKVRRPATAPPGPDDPVLVEALTTATEKERTAQDLVARLGKKRRAALLERLAERGILRREQGKVLGLFPRTRWPARDSSHEQQLRSRLRAALLHGAQPDERTTAVITLLAALEIAHRVVDGEGLSSREVKKRAKELAESDWTAKAVRDAVQAVQAGMVTALAVGGAAVAGGS